MVNAMEKNMKKEMSSLTQIKRGGRKTNYIDPVHAVYLFLSIVGFFPLCDSQPKLDRLSQ